MDWFRRWDIWGVVIGVLGIAVAAYTFYVTDKVGRISYSYDTQRVFDPAILSGFTLVDSKHESIKQPVYATDVVVWNSGDLSLSENSDRVREPITISVEGTIHYFILSKANIVPQDNYRISIASDKKSLSINWRYFDPPQGIRLTIVHSHSSPARLTVSGRFFETSLVERAEPAEKDKRRVSIIISAFMFAITIIVACVFIFVVWRKKRRGEEVNKSDYVPVVLMLFQCGVFGSIFFSQYFPNGPPV